MAGIVAGNGLFGGAMSGAAPGAKLVSVRVCLFIAGCTAHALIEGMIYAAKQANVDVINMSIGGLPALNDGNNSRCVLYDRLIEQSNVQMFISAGNSGPGENTVGDPGVCDKVVSVGAYITDATWESNYGSTGPTADNLHPFSSRGPPEDGGVQAPRRRAGRRHLHDAAVAAGRPGRRAPIRCRPGTRCSTARRWRRRRRPARRRCSSAPPSRPASRTSPTSCARR